MNLNQLGVVKPLASTGVKHDLGTRSALRLKQLRLRLARRKARKSYQLSSTGFPVTHRISA